MRDVANRWFRRRKWSFDPFGSEDATDFTQTPEGYDIDIGWRFKLRRGDELRHVMVLVARGALGRTTLPRRSRKAIASRGWTAVHDVLTLDEPPPVLVVDQSGVHEGEPPQADEDGSGVSEPRRPMPPDPAREVAVSPDDE
jgi:hypothetical protein